MGIVARKTLAAAFLAVVLAVPALAAQQPAPTVQVRVKVDAARIRSSSSLTDAGNVVANATRGTMLEVVRRENNWFLVRLTPTLGARAETGFIHESVVEVFVSPMPAAARAKPSLTDEEVKTERPADPSQRERAPSIQSSDAWARYNAEEKSELAAAAIEWFIPVLGHAYAGDARRGVKPALVTAAGFGGVIVGVVAGGNGGVALVGLGLVTMAGGRVWGIVSALETARDHNNDLKRRLNLTVGPAFGDNGAPGVRVGFALRF